MLEFLFPRHLRRLSYFFRLLLLNATLYCLLPYVEASNAHTSTYLPIFGGALLAMLYGVVFVFLPRLRDCGLPPWILVFAFIPYVSSVLGVLLLFKRSRLSCPWGHTDHPPDAPMEIPTVAGSTCSACGKRLLLTSDGLVTPANKVLCHECHAKEPHPAP